jgi:hypothetical protein
MFPSSTRHNTALSMLNRNASSAAATVLRRDRYCCILSAWRSVARACLPSDAASAVTWSDRGIKQSPRDGALVQTIASTEPKLH